MLVLSSHMTIHFHFVNLVLPFIVGLAQNKMKIKMNLQSPCIEIKNVVFMFLVDIRQLTFCISGPPIYRMKFCGATDLSRWCCIGKITTSSKLISPLSILHTRWKLQRVQPGILTYISIRKIPKTKSSPWWW